MKIENFEFLENKNRIRIRNVKTHKTSPTDAQTKCITDRNKYKYNAIVSM